MSIKRRWPWIAQQTWKNVLFIHFPVPYKDLKKHIPKPFKLETFGGQAWIGVVLFEALNSRLRGMPTPLSYRYFLQLNVRTYVKFGHEPGVFFFSIDANRKLPVLGAKLFSLPYFLAQMDITKQGINYRFNSKRKIKDQLQSPLFDIHYKPISEPFFSEEDSLVYWFTERYCIWTVKGNKIYKGPISHHPWRLQSAKVSMTIDHEHPLFNQLTQSSPITHYCFKMHAYVHPFEQKGIYLN